MKNKYDFCPFCGSMDIDTNCIMYLGKYYLQCKTCYAIGPKRNTPEEALKAWRERADHATYTEMQKCPACNRDPFIREQVGINGHLYAVRCSCGMCAPYKSLPIEAIQEWNRIKIS